MEKITGNQNRPIKTCFAFHQYALFNAFADKCNISVADDKSNSLHKFNIGTKT